MHRGSLFFCGIVGSGPHGDPPDKPHTGRAELKQWRWVHVPTQWGNEADPLPNLICGSASIDPVFCTVCSEHWSFC